MTRVVTIVWLIVLWLLLWRDASVANVVSGLLLAVVVTARTRIGPSQHRLRPLALVRFVGYFAWKLVEANFVLAREVLTPGNGTNTGIIGVSMAGYHEFVVTVVANAISLTPGTLTLEITREPEPTIYVHVLHLFDLDATRAEVTEMARRAGAAFPAIEPPSTTDHREVSG